MPAASTIPILLAFMRTVTNPRCSSLSAWIWRSKARNSVTLSRGTETVSRQMDYLRRLRRLNNYFFCFRNANYSRAICWGPLWRSWSEPYDIRSCHSSMHPPAAWIVSCRRRMPPWSSNRSTSYYKSKQCFISVFHVFTASYFCSWTSMSETYRWLINWSGILASQTTARSKWRWKSVPNLAWAVNLWLPLPTVFAGSCHGISVHTPSGW